MYLESQVNFLSIDDLFRDKITKREYRDDINILESYFCSKKSAVVAKWQLFRDAFNVFSS